MKKVEDKSVQPLPIEIGSLTERKVSENSKPGASKPSESRWKELRPSEDSQQILASKVKKEKPMSQSLSMDNLLENFSLGNRKISDSKMQNNFDFDSVNKAILFSKSIYIRYISVRPVTEEGKIITRELQSFRYSRQSQGTLRLSCEE